MHNAVLRNATIDQFGPWVHHTTPPVSHNAVRDIIAMIASHAPMPLLIVAIATLMAGIVVLNIRDKRTERHVDLISA